MAYRYYTYTDPTTKKPQIIEWGGTEEESAQEYTRFREQNPTFVGGEMKLSPTQLDISSGISPQPFPERDARTTAATPVQDLNQQLAAYLQTQISGRETKEADIETIRRQERTDAEALLNAQIRNIELRVAQQVEAEREKETRLLASQRGINIRGGLAGSPFATAAKEEIRGVSREKVGVIRGLGQSEIDIARGKVNQALTEIEGRARTRMGELEEKQLGLIEKGAELVEKDKIAGLSNLATFAKANMSWEDVVNSGILEQIRADTGLPDKILELNFKSNLPEKQIEFKMEKVGDKMFVWEINKRTGELKRRSDMDVSVPTANEGEYSTVQTDDGTILLVPKKGIDPNKSLDQQILQYGAEGQFAEPEKPPGYMELPDATLREIVAEGIAPDIANGIWTDIVSGVYSEEQIKENLRKQGQDPADYDTVLKFVKKSPGGINVTVLPPGE